jgi:hypothetical protein
LCHRSTPALPLGLGDAVCAQAAHGTGRLLLAFGLEHALLLLRFAALVVSTPDTTVT